MSAEGIQIEGDLEKLLAEIESGLACRGYMRRVWQRAEAEPTILGGGGSALPTEEWIELPDDDR
jgi:hypothetical protein